MQFEVLSTIFALNTSVMLALGTGLIVLITVAGVGLGFVGGWFCFKYARRKNIFNDTDRDYFQNLLFRAETAEEKLTKNELNLAKTGDRANILESSHRVIQDELAEERQNSQMLTAELTRGSTRQSTSGYFAVPRPIRPELPCGYSQECWPDHRSWPDLARFWSIFPRRFPLGKGDFESNPCLYR